MLRGETRVLLPLWVSQGSRCRTCRCNSRGSVNHIGELRLPMCASLFCYRSGRLKHLDMCSRGRPSSISSWYFFMFVTGAVSVSVVRKQRCHRYLASGQCSDSSGLNAPPTPCAGDSQRRFRCSQRGGLQYFQASCQWLLTTWDVPKFVTGLGAISF